MAVMDFFSYQARKARVDKPETPAAIPEVEELAARPAPIEVEEKTASDTFIERFREDIRKLWGK